MKPRTLDDVDPIPVPGDKLDEAYDEAYRPSWMPARDRIDWPFGKRVLSEADAAAQEKA